MRAGTRIREWLRRGAWALLAVAALMIALLAAAQTSPGKQFIAARAAGLASAFSGFSIEIEGVSGWLPFAMQARRVTVADANGVFLSLEHIRLDWSARSLLRGNVRVHVLSARRVEITRVPKFPPRRKPRPGGRFALPALPGPPRWLAVDALIVEEFVLGERVLGEAAVFRLDGEAGAVSPGEWAAQVAAVRTDAEETRARAAFRATADGLALDVEARDEALFPAMLGVDPPFLLSLAGRGVDGVWTVSLALDGGDTRVATLDEARLVLGPPLETAGALAVNTAHPVFRAALAPRLGETGNLAFDLTLAGDGALAVRAFEFASARASAKISGSADLANMRFDIEMDMRHEDAAELVPALSGDAPAPLRAGVTATGSLDALETAATVTLDGQPLWGSALTVAARPPYGVRGRFHVAPPTALLPEQTRSLVADGAQGRVAVRLDRGPVVEIEELEVAAAGARVSARGAVDLPGERVDLAWSLDADALAVYGGLLDAPLSGALKAEGTLTGGPGEEARLTAALRATEFAAGPARMDSAWLDLTVTAGAWAGGAIADLHAEAAGEVRQLTVAGAPPADLSLVAHAHSPDLDRVTVAQLTVTAPGATLDLHGDASLVSLAGAGTLTFTGDDLGALLAPFGVPGAGGADLEAAVDFDARARSVEAVLRGKGDGLAGLPAPLDALGESFTLDARAAFEKDTLKVAGLQLDSPNLSVSGGGTYALAANGADLRLEGRAKSLAPFGALAGVPLGGRLDATLTAQGPPDAIAAEISARAEDLQVGDAGVSLANATARVEGLPAAPRGEVALTFEREARSLRVNAAFAVEEERLVLEPVTLAAGGNNVSGRADVVLVPLEGRGEFEADLPDLSYFGALLGIPLDGSVETRAEFEWSDGAAWVRASGQAAGVESGVLRLDEAVFDVRAEGLPAAPALNATLDAQGLVLEGGHALHSLHATAAGDATRTRMEARWDGAVLDGTPFRGTLEANAAPNAPAVTLNRLEGALGAFPFRLSVPATLSGAAGEYALDALELRFGEGTVSASGSYTEAAVDFRAALHEFPLAVAELAGAPELSGTLSGEATLAGPPSAPRATARFDVAGLRTDAMPETAPALSAHFASAAVDGFVSCQATLDAGDAGTATARAELPAIFSLQPAAVAVEPDAPLDGAVDADLNLGPLVCAFAPPEHHLDGALTARFEVGGTLGAPELRGEARVLNARYENAVTGTLLDRLNATAESSGTRVRLVEMSATDGAEGAVEARGALDLAGEAFPFEMDVDIASARLVRRDDVTGNVGGTLRVAGNLREVAVSGELVAGPAVVRVPEKLPPPTLPQTEVIEVNVPGAPAAARDSEPPMRIALDVWCRVPRRVIVRAPVLDTEWEGDLHVLGTADSPRVDGLLRIHKGYLDFLGRRFELDGSTLSFDGSADLMPYVNLEGRADTRDITGILRVTGKPDQLRFTLDSEPVYPEDEVLARLLFGRRLDELSPVQAVQLARAATMLAGSVGGLRFLAGEMGAPGLGGFDVRAGDAPGEAVVGVGAYITDSIYAEIEQSTGSRDTRSRVNIQLTPQFSLEAETGTGKTQGGGLFWKREF